MATSLQDQLRASRAKTERWIRERDAEVRRAVALAEARGRQVYAQTIKTGGEVLARTPAELRELGMAAMRGQLPQAAGAMAVRAVASQSGAKGSRGSGAPRAQISPREAGRVPAAQRPSGLTGKILQQGRAAVSGAVDEASFGLADHVLAAGNAVGSAIQDGDLEDFTRDYSASMATKRAEDKYDAEHYALSRNIGRATGFVGSVAALGAPGLARAALAAIPRGRAASQVARLGLRYAPDPRGLTTMAAAGGGAAGMVDQVAGDTIAGRRTGAADLVSSGLGGAIGGVATRFAGPGVGGAVAGGAGSILGDVSNHRDISLEEAADAAQAGAAFGAAGGELGVDWVRNLSSQGKGHVGDFMSKVKAISRGDKLSGAQQRVYLNPVSKPQEWTVADYLSRDPKTGRLRVGEAKMGPRASLSPRQIQARNQFGDDYIVDFWSFSDVGKATGAAVSPFGATWTDEPRQR